MYQVFKKLHCYCRCSINSINDQLSSKIVSLKHIPIPNIPQESIIVFELYMFSFTTMASFLQFLHLYRSVWWLPQSYTRYTMVSIMLSINDINMLKFCCKIPLFFQNFYLIDPYLVGFIITILGRRLVYSILNHLVSKCAPSSLWPLLQKLLTLLLLTAVLTSLVFCTFHIMKNHPIVNIFYLCYP